MASTGQGSATTKPHYLDDGVTRRVMHITIDVDLIDRVHAVHSRTGQPIGRILEDCIRKHLAGVRLPSVPAHLIPKGKQTASPPPEVSEESPVSLMVESGQMTEDTPPAPSGKPVHAGGGGEKGKKPLGEILDPRRKSKAG